MNEVEAGWRLVLFDGARPSIMDRSTAGRVTPTGSFVLSVFNNAWDGRVTAGKRQHLFAARQIGLSVIIRKRYALRIVVIPGLLAVRTTWFCIDQ